MIPRPLTEEGSLSALAIAWYEEPPAEFPSPEAFDPPRSTESPA